MKRMMITESVRNLLLDSDFLESVLGSPIVEPDANSGGGRHLLESLRKCIFLPK